MNLQDGSRCIMHIINYIRVAQQRCPHPLGAGRLVLELDWQSTCLQQLQLQSLGTFTVTVCSDMTQFDCIATRSKLHMATCIFHGNH